MVVSAMPLRSEACLQRLTTTQQRVLGRDVDASPLSCTSRTVTFSRRRAERWLRRSMAGSYVFGGPLVIRPLS